MAGTGIPSPSIPDPADAPPTRLTCTEAAARAEAETGVPAGLLLAIGRIESGRADRVTGRVSPWPWTTNAGGAGHFFDGGDAAAAWVRDQQAQGVRSIDAGCFQVNLYYHPKAFASVEEAFDPTANARYAATFLAGLRDRTGSWESAVAAYHSAVPAEGGWYRQRVLASWHGGDLTVPVRLRAEFADRPRMDDPHVIFVSAAAGAVRGMQVWTPRAYAEERARETRPAPQADPASQPPYAAPVSRVIAMRYGRSRSRAVAPAIAGGAR